MAVWIVDTDGGIDDAQAVVLGLSQREGFAIAAITIVAGNVGLEQAAKNVFECLRVTGRTDVPVFLGAGRPMVAPLRDVSANIHGQDGLGNYWEREFGTERGPELQSPRPGHAALEIIRLANQHPGHLNIVTIGPLTNLALALCLDPSLPSKLSRVVLMGGAPTANGNITTAAEFNIWCDPEAAHIVFERLDDIELVSWELCIDPKSRFPEDWKREYVSQTTPKGIFIGKIAGNHVEMCDPMALAVAIDPTVILKFVKKEGFVELAGSRTRGMTVINWEGSDLITVRTALRKNLKIVLEVDMEKVCALLLGSVKQE